MSAATQPLQYAMFSTACVHATLAAPFVFLPPPSRLISINVFMLHVAGGFCIPSSSAHATGGLLFGSASAIVAALAAQAAAAARWCTFRCRALYGERLRAMKNGLQGFKLADTLYDVEDCFAAAAR